MATAQLYIQTGTIVISVFLAIFAGILVNNKTMDTMNKRIDDTNRLIEGFRDDTNRLIEGFRGDTNRRIEEFRVDTNRRIDDTNKRIDDFRAEIHQDLRDIRGMLQEVLRTRA